MTELHVGHVPVGDGLDEFAADFEQVRAGGDEFERDLLAGCFAPVCTIVGKTWGLHLEKVVRVDRAENLAMIAESVAFLLEAGKRVALVGAGLVRRSRWPWTNREMRRNGERG